MTRTIRRTIPAALAVLGMSVVLGACQQGTPGGEPTPTESATITTSPSPSPSPSESKTPEEEATELGEQAVRDYYDVEAAAMQDPEDFKQEELKSVAIGSALNDLQNQLSAARGLKQHAIGATKIVDIKEPKTDLKPKGDDVPTVEFLVCYDVSDLNIVDEDGKSVVSPDRKDTGVKRVGVANYDYPDADQWRVAFTEYKEDLQCDDI
ncbi:hypothetical protein ACQFYA_21005 [Promicromonospora sp. Marseille-Q5078]